MMTCFAYVGSPLVLTVYLAGNIYKLHRRWYIDKKKVVIFALVLQS